MGFTTTTTTTTTTNSSNNNTSNVISSNGRSIVLAEVVVAKAAAHKHNRHRHKKAFRAIIIFISITITITIRQSPSSPHRGNLRHVSVASLAWSKFIAVLKTRSTTAYNRTLLGSSPCKVI